MVHAGRFTAQMEGEFAVFLIGMRINNPLMVHRWLPVATAMPRMLQELYRHPELGFLHAEAWFARTFILVQYWRSVEQLLAYATKKDTEHLPAWKSFNQAARHGSVGIWHETYVVKPGSYESIYVDMPPFGLGRAGTLASAAGAREKAAGRLGRNPDSA